MTNKEWLLKEIQNTSDKKLAESVKISFFTDYCERDCNGENCVDCRLEWFKQEHKEKIELSEAERIILKNIDKEYSWIARDENKALNVYKERPIKRGADDNDWRVS